MTTPKTDTPKTDTPKTDTPKTDTPKIDTAAAKRIAACIDAIRSAHDGTYVRKGMTYAELAAIKAAAALITPLMSSDIDAAGGTATNYVVNICRYHVASKAWQTMVSFPIDVHSSKVCPAGNRTPVDALEWFVPAAAADIKAAADGNSNRVHTVTIDGKPVRLKGNAKTGAPVKVKMSMPKYFKDHVGAAMRDALFAALPDASVNHETDVSIKARRWDIQLVPTKQVSVSVKH